MASLSLGGSVPLLCPNATDIRVSRVLCHWKELQTFISACACSLTFFFCFVSRSVQDWLYDF